MNGSDLGTWILDRLFGGGPVGGLAARGVAYLGQEVREAINKSDQRVATVRLQPGESYTVTAYPKPTRKVRKLTKRQEQLVGEYRSQTKASRSQLRAARRLKRAQRRLDRVRPGSKRYLKRERIEAQRGLDFDRAMRPSRKQVRTATELDRVSRELQRLRQAQLRQARRSGSTR